MVAKRTFLVSCVAVLAIAAGACSSSGSGPHTERAQDATATVPATTTTADPQAADKAAVLAAYNRYWDLSYQALGVPNGQPHQVAEIANYAWEKALDALVNDVQALIERHQAVHGPLPDGHPAVACIRSGRAVVRNDYVDADDTYDASDRVISAHPGASQVHEEAVLIQTPRDSHWAVSERYISSSGRPVPSEGTLCGA